MIMIYTEALTLQEQFQEHINNTFIIFANFEKKKNQYSGMICQEKESKDPTFSENVICKWLHIVY